MARLGFIEFYYSTKHKPVDKYKCDNTNVLNLLKSLEAKGVETSVYLASSSEVEGVSGKYFDRKKAVRSSDVSYDRAAAERLWQVSLELTGVNAPAM